MVEVPVRQTPASPALGQHAAAPGRALPDGRAQRQALLALLAGLRTALESVAEARRGAQRRRRGLLQRRLLLGLELLCKLEDQVLFPALAEALQPPATRPRPGADDDLAGARPLHAPRPPHAMPASAQAHADDDQQALATARREVELLRDLSMLVTRTAAANRDTVVSVLEGMFDLHARRVDALVEGLPPGSVPWAALEQEMRGLLGRWRDEVLADGDIEDEDRDPVGLPPR